MKSKRNNGENGENITKWKVKYITMKKNNEQNGKQRRMKDINEGWREMKKIENRWKWMKNEEKWKRRKRKHAIQWWKIVKEKKYKRINKENIQKRRKADKRTRR